jgi:hypothetical protein
MPDSNLVSYPVHIYTVGFRWSGTLSLPLSIRISDYLNDTNWSFLSLEQVTLSAWDKDEFRDLTKLEVTAVNKPNVVALFTGAGAPTTPRNNVERVAKVTHRLMFYASPYAIVGNLHLIRESNWLQTLQTSRLEFFSVTDATVCCLDSSSSSSQTFDFGVVSRQWIAAIHPMGLQSTRTPSLSQGMQQSRSRMRDLGAIGPSGDKPG